MLTWEDYTKSKSEVGFIETISKFCRFIERESFGRVLPDYTYQAHAILDDFNMDDGDITGWAFDQDKINESLVASFGLYGIPDPVNFDASPGSDEYWRDDTHVYWAILWAYDQIDSFLRWMLTIPEDERYAELDW